MQIQTILAFGGHSEAAIQFYQAAIGAEVQVMLRWKDSPDPAMRTVSSDPEKIMHASFRIGDTILMATDGIETLAQPDIKGITLNLEARDDSEARQLFAALSNGGNVQMPLTKTFWTSLSGMLTDRFGVSWMVNVAQPAS
ncbi:VOC family protein [Undibacterium sp. CY18W]|uniref:VOC family protein n=1 Tax=Undibacterium hunanense TaxID=2762292 RepID=A0ABR6ZUI4_9BURK|nr:VOC family protein [Undibacterium hunanense]MBC3919518.1 VOC family protein [Undibacterium hunanense]